MCRNVCQALCDSPVLFPLPSDYKVINITLHTAVNMLEAVEMPGPRCIKLFTVFFKRQKSENCGNKNISIAICLEICQNFLWQKKSLAKSFMQWGPGVQKY